MFTSRILLILGLLLSFGCGGSPALSPLPDHKPSAFDRLEHEISTTTSIYPRPAGQERPEVPQPQFVRGDGKIHLADLDITLRKVTFDEPIDGYPALFFSETEITNQAFATFLADTDQLRDDTPLEQVEEKRSSGVVTRTSDGTTSVTLFSSTGWPSASIAQKSSLWRNGQFPAGHDDYPVSFISMPDAMNFCKWLTARYELNGEFRLPTEEEWVFAAYGTDRKFPWGDDERVWTATTTQPVKARPELRTPDGLYEMWGNVSELVLSPWNGYGGKIQDKYFPMITQWLGTGYADEEVRGEHAKPRQDYWGYTHSSRSRSDTWGFRIVFLPSVEN